MNRNMLVFVAASVAALFLWYRLVDRIAPLPAPVAAASSSAAAASPAHPVVLSAAPTAAPAARAARPKTEHIVRVSNDFYDAVLSNRGARFVALRLKGVSSMSGGTRDQGLNLVTPADDPLYGTLSLAGTDLDTGLWTLLTPSPERTPGGTVVRFSAMLPYGGLSVVKTFSFDDHGRGIGVDVEVRNSGSRAVELSSPLVLTWGPDLGGDGGGIGGRLVRGAVVQLDGSVERVNASRDSGSTAYAAPRWVALKNHYFTVALFPGQGSPWTSAGVDRLGSEHLAVSLQAAGLALAPGASRTLKASLWAGPQDYTLLKSVGENFQAVLQFQTWSFFSWINPLCVWLLYILKGFYALTGNWGVAIILLTLLIRGALFYPSMKSMVSMRHMQRKQAVLKPRLETLKKTYKDNPQKLNEETMKLYKEFGVNPLGGCLPMLIQIPVFFALYDTLASAYELRGAGFLWRWTDLSAGDPTYIFPVAMGISMFVQQKLTPTAAAASDEQVQMQKMMLWLMPGMFMVMALFYKWPVGLLLYWTASNLVGVVQQVVVNRVVKD